MMDDEKKKPKEEKLTQGINMDFDDIDDDVLNDCWAELAAEKGITPEMRK